MSCIRKEIPRNNPAVVKVSGLIWRMLVVCDFGGVVFLFVEVGILKPPSGACY